MTATATGTGIVHLTERMPQISGAEMVAALVPPPQFADATFDTYRADAAFPSQQEAKDLLIAFSGGGAPAKRGGLFSRAKRGPELKPGVYLDGGFGVGKTHLLAAVYHAHARAPEVLRLVHRVHRARRRTRLQEHGRAVPRLRPAVHRRVRARRPGRHDGDDAAARASSSPPARGWPRHPTPRPTRSAKAGSPRRTSCARSTRCPRASRPSASTAPTTATAAVDGHAEVLEPAALRGRDRRCRDDGPASRTTRSPSSWRTSRACTRRATSASSTGSSVVGLRDVEQLTDQSAALRFVAFIDRVYDAELPIRATGLSLDLVFPEEMLAGGYRKKYLRAISRLVASTLA